MIEPLHKHLTAVHVRTYGPRGHTRATRVNVGNVGLFARYLRAAAFNFSATFFLGRLYPSIKQSTYIMSRALLMTIGDKDMLCKDRQDIKKDVRFVDLSVESVDSGEQENYGKCSLRINY